MKVAIPTEGKNGMDEKVSPHFGRAPTFTIVDTESGAVEIEENTGEHMGGSVDPPEILHAHGVEAVVCANLGRGARERLCGMGMTVYIGAGGSVREALGLFKENKLAAASDESVCGEGMHEHHHGEHRGHGCCEGYGRHRSHQRHQ